MTTTTTAGPACRSKPRTDHQSALPVRQFLKRYFPLSRQVRVFGIGLMLLITVLRAQIQPSIVFGKITRQNNQPVTQVLVSIAGKIAYTDDGGRYRIDGVPLGRQTMLVTSRGTVLLRVAVTISGSEQRIDKTLPNVTGG